MIIIKQRTTEDIIKDMMREESQYTRRVMAVRKKRIEELARAKVVKTANNKEKKLTPLQMLAWGAAGVSLVIGLGVAGSNDLYYEQTRNQDTSSLQSNNEVTVDKTAVTNDFFSEETIKKTIESVANEYSDTIDIITENENNEAVIQTDEDEVREDAIITSFNDFKDKYVEKDIDYTNEQKRIMIVDDLSKKQNSLYDAQISEYNLKLNTLDKDSDEHGILLEQIENIKENKKTLSDNRVFILKAYNDQGIITFGMEDNKGNVR